MPRSNLEGKIARLQNELEKRSEELREKMANLPSTTGPKVREAYAKRAQLLTLRVRRLGEMLEEREEERQTSTQPKARVRRSSKSHR